MKIFLQFILGLISSIIFGFIGFTNGANFGGNYGFPRFGGGVGWESGGLFFGLIGISIGSFVGIMLAKKLQKEPLKLKIASITTIIIICVELLISWNGIPEFIGIIALLLPSIGLTVATNRR